SCTGTNIELADSHTEAFRGTECFRVVAKRVLRFGHTHRHFIFAGVFELLELLLGCWGEVNAFTAVNIFDDVLDAGTRPSVCGKHWLDWVVAFLQHALKFGCQRFGAFTAVGPNTDHFSFNPASFTEVFDPLQFFFSVLWELVDGHNDGGTIGFDVIEVTSQVPRALFHRFDVSGALVPRLTRLVHRESAVVGHGTDGRNDGHGGGSKATGRTGDIHEFFGTQISTKAGFGDNSFRQIQCGVGSNHRVGTVSDIGEWSTVNQRRGTTDRLDKVWFHGIAQQNSHATLCTIWSK